jgi:hypothetical protein
MKTFKQFDLIGQIMLLIFFFLYMGAYLEKLTNHHLQGYFALGGWQVTSCIVHMVARYNQKPGSPRWWYQLILFILFLTGLFSMWKNIVFMLILLFLSPVLALYYCRVCYLELKKEAHEK